MNHCATCGTLLPHGSQFCPKCGADLRQPAAVVPPPAVSTPIPATEPAAEKSHWWLVPLVIIGIVIVAFLLLMGLPFGGREEGPARTASAETETIAEGTAPSSPNPASTGTLIDVEEVPPQPAAVTTVAPTPAPTTTTPAAPAPAVVEQPAAEPPPMTSAAPPPSREGEIDEDEAISTLRGYLVTRNYYQTGAGCLTVSSEGYANVGYTLNVRDRCGSRALGRWRVDAKTREVFRQREDGRFLRP